jgi:hypothetical protein
LKEEKSPEIVLVRLKVMLRLYKQDRLPEEEIREIQELIEEHKRSMSASEPHLE